MAIVFFGNEQLATGVSTNSSAMKALIDNGYKPHVVNKGAKDMAGQLRSLKPDIGVVVAYGEIIPANIIELFPYGIINIHPSLLPKGRGPAPIEQTILDGEKETGVSIMQLSLEMDKGSILAQQKLNLRGNETKQELADTLLNLGSELLIKCLADVFSGNAKKTPQSDSEATYTHKIQKSDGIIDWTKPADRIEREIRAYAGWPKSRTTLKDIDCILLQADVSEESGTPGDFKIKDKRLITMFAGKGSLVIKRIQPAGKNEMSAEEFLRGYGSRLQ